MANIYFLRYVVIGLFFAGFQCVAQVLPKVVSSVDTTSIKIGEQIHFKITVDADSTAQVVFPEGQTFSPLEMVEAMATDTLKKQDRVTLQRTYALTQFDSGAYTLPQQKIDINGKMFLTDSLQINVASVPVDTLAQKMYDIKPLINVQKSKTHLWKAVLWGLLGLIAVAGLGYWFFIRKKPLTQEEKEALLPPYDRALLELKRLENSKYIIQEEYKQYYSELTGIVRSYIEEDVHVSAMESTTDQLIGKLELLKDAGELKLDNDTLNQFKKVLQTADLVKFAKSRPETSVAEQDRKTVEQIVVKTKEALPEPTVEELMLKEEYLEEQAHRKQRKKWMVAGAIALGVLVISAATAISYYGFDYVKDTVLGNPTKKLLEGEWVSSSYGYPPIILETPKVLIRQEVKLPAGAKAKIKEVQVFMYKNPVGLFSVTTASTTFTQQVEPDFDKATEQLLKSFEDKGAKNITTKKEEFDTTTGTKGLKTYGEGEFAVPDSKDLIKGKYVVLSFGGKGFQQQIMITWMDGDSYAEKIVDRIIRSVEVKTET